MKSFVKTVDDFGFNHQINSKIIKWFKTGKVDQIATVVNTTNFNEDYKMLTETKVPTILHFNIVNGYPLSDPVNIPTLVDSKGKFWGIFFFWRLIRRKVSFKEIETELQAQIQKIEEKNINIIGFNSHYNVHLFTPIYQIVKKYFKPKQIRLWKTTKRNLWKNGKVRLFVFLILGLFVKINKNGYQSKTENIVHPFWFENKGSFCEIWKFFDKKSKSFNIR